jgi:hypothetical protein
MSRSRKRPRGLYARVARARGVPLNAIRRKLDPGKPCEREKQECDASPPWDEDDLVRMDRAFCDAMEREIARGTERPRLRAAAPAPRAIHPGRPGPRRTGTFPAEPSPRVRERDRSC